MGPPVAVTSPVAATVTALCVESTGVNTVLALTVWMGARSPGGAGHAGSHSSGAHGSAVRLRTLPSAPADHVASSSRERGLSRVLPVPLTHVDTPCPVGGSLATAPPSKGGCAVRSRSFARPPTAERRPTGGAGGPLWADPWAGGHGGDAPAGEPPAAVIRGQ